MYDCFGLCNILTAFDPPFKMLFCEDFNCGVRFKRGG
jgi:hypothetical protein